MALYYLKREEEREEWVLCILWTVWARFINIVQTAPKNVSRSRGGRGMGETGEQGQRQLCMAQCTMGCVGFLCKHNLIGA